MKEAQGLLDRGDEAETEKEEDVAEPNAILEEIGDRSVHGYVVGFSEEHFWCL